MHTVGDYAETTYPIIGTELAVGDLEQFKVEADLLAEHFQQVDAEPGAALIELRVRRRVVVPANNAQKLSLALLRSYLQNLNSPRSVADVTHQEVTSPVVDLL